MVTPAPSLVGRLRLRRSGARRPAAAAPAPIVPFTSVHREEAVADCEPDTGRDRRTPSRGARDRRRSADDTIAEAERAGAGGAHQNRGLGAAVRVGLAAGVERALRQWCSVMRTAISAEELANLCARSWRTGRPCLREPVPRRYPAHASAPPVRNQVYQTLSVIARRRITDGQTRPAFFPPPRAPR